SENRVVTMAVNYLNLFRNTHASFVVEQIRPYLDRNQEWNQRIAGIMIYISNWKSAEGAFELLMYLVQKGNIDIQASNHVLVNMSKSNIQAGCQLLRLNGEIAFKKYQDLKVQQTNSDITPFPENDLRDAVDSWEVRNFISVVSQKNPQALLDFLLPW